MYKVAHTSCFKKHFLKVILVVLFSVTIKFSTYCIFKNRISLFVSCNQGRDLKNRVTIGKFSMDAKKLHFYEFSNIGVGLGPGELRLKMILVVLWTPNTTCIWNVHVVQCRVYAYL